MATKDHRATGDDDDGKGDHWEARPPRTDAGAAPAPMRAPWDRPCVVAIPLFRASASQSRNGCGGSQLRAQMRCGRRRCGLVTPGDGQRQQLRPRRPHRRGHRRGERAGTAASGHVGLGHVGLGAAPPKAAQQTASQAQSARSTHRVPLEHPFSTRCMSVARGRRCPATGRRCTSAANSTAPATPTRATSPRGIPARRAGGRCAVRSASPRSARPTRPEMTNFRTRSGGVHSLLGLRGACTGRPAAPHREDAQRAARPCCA